ncbi:MAG TPA: winged helix-turn-helix domain-containing protein [Thermoanaerobaculia bacterium]
MRVRFDGFILDTDRKDLSRGGAAVRLTPRAFRLLSFLVAERPRAISKRDLLDHIWSGQIVEEANLKTLVLEIRTALEERGGTAKAIRTVYGFGYAFGSEAVDDTAVSAQERLVRVTVQERIISLPEGIHEIGRNANCAVFIDAASVSRVHARLHVGRETLVIEDNKSKNGTFVAGRRIAVPLQLARESQVRCGDVELTVERMSGEPADTATI